jgi:hypothetical protein
MLKKIGYGALAALLIIQFIKPARNISDAPTPNDISNKYAVQAEVDAILKTSCYDCHSNNTRYPWYANIQPVAWWLADHVDEGKREINFNEFLSYKPKKAHHKMEEVAEMVNEGEMPLQSYTIVHRDANLSDAQRKLLADWALGVMQEIATEHNLGKKDSTATH